MAERGWIDSDLAGHLPIHRSSLSRCKSGESEPTKAFFEEVCSVINKDYSWLVYGFENASVAQAEAVHDVRERVELAFRYLLLSPEAAEDLTGVPLCKLRVSGNRDIPLLLEDIYAVSAVTRLSIRWYLFGEGPDPRLCLPVSPWPERFEHRAESMRLSVDAVAQLLGFTPKEVHRYLSGATLAPVEFLRAAAMSLDTTVTWLLFGGQSEPLLPVRQTWVERLCGFMEANCADTSWLSAQGVEDAQLEHIFRGTEPADYALLRSLSVAMQCDVSWLAFGTGSGPENGYEDDEDPPTDRHGVSIAALVHTMPTASRRLRWAFIQTLFEEGIASFPYSTVGEYLADGTAARQKVAEVPPFTTHSARELDQLVAQYVSR